MEVKRVTLAASLVFSTAIIFTPGVFAAESSNNVVNASSPFVVSQLKNEVTLSGGVNVSNLLTHRRQYNSVFP
ncbi:MAG: hypothetical protein Q8L78_07615 [Coxiellaceae bacterium]|nr:hypothetical protein [Coxiellaceae bacterium]